MNGRPAIVGLVVIFGCLCAVEGESSASKDDATLLAGRLQDITTKAVDENVPVDIFELRQTVDRLKGCITGLDDNERAKVISELGRLLSYPEDIKIDWKGRRLTGVDPRTGLNASIIGLLETLADKRELPWLNVVYQRRRAQEIKPDPDPEALTNRLGRLIVKLGGDASTQPVSLGSIRKTDSAAAKSPVPDFAALDDDAAVKAADAIVENYRVQELELTNQLDSQKTPAKQKVLLMYALGQMRSRWAVASLVRMVDFEAPFTPHHHDSAAWGKYPAVDALAGIGDPAVRRIVRVLPTVKDDLRVHLLLTVIWQVEGEKPGQARLENAIAAAHDDATKNSLQNALKEFQAMASRLR